MKHYLCSISVPHDGLPVKWTHGPWLICWLRWAQRLLETKEACKREAHESSLERDHQCSVYSSFSCDPFCAIWIELQVFDWLLANQNFSEFTAHHSGIPSMQSHDGWEVGVYGHAPPSTKPEQDGFGRSVCSYFVFCFYFSVGNMLYCAISCGSH